MVVNTKTCVCSGHESSDRHERVVCEQRPLACFACPADPMTSGTSGVEYERRRYERALAGRTAAEGLPKTYAWVQETLQEVSNAVVMLYCAVH